MTVIRLENVHAKFPSGAKLNNITIEIKDGEYVSMLGPTGSGPTEILQVIAGLVKPTSGKIYFDDLDVTEFEPEDRQIGMVFEQFNLFPHLSVLDNLLFGPRMRDENIKEKEKVVEEVLAMVRLDGRENAISRELSGGMQQRVGVARAIVAGSKLLLLDQPYRALDAKIRGEMRMEVMNIVKGLGINALHSTHETEEAMLVSDRIAIFQEGNLEQFDTPANIFDFPISKFVALFVAESNLWDIKIKSNEIVLDKLKMMYNISKYPGDNYSSLVVRQHAIDLFFKDSLVPKNWIQFDGVVQSVRLLGEFIRIVVNVDGTEFVVRDLLNPDLKNPLALVRKKLTLGFPLDEILLF